jgi:dTDP-4-dehydrorhamnose reductase
MKKKMLVIGGTSLLGYKLLSNTNDFELYASYNKNLINLKNVETLKIDITNKKNCEKILNLKPDIIINTAAITNVDYCEKFEKNAFDVNVTGTKNIAKIAEKLGSKLIHISTDAVFSGSKKFYVEEDKPNPISIYGKTKLESEKIVSKVTDSVILRPSVLFGWIPFEYIKTKDESRKTMNFGLWIIDQLYKNNKMSIVNDQINTPTLADNLAENIIEVIKKDLTGIYHLSGLSCISRLDFSKKIAKTFGYSDNLISSISSEKLKQIAPRTLESCLKCDKIVENGVNLLKIDQSIEKMYNQIKLEKPEIIGKTS